jgi:phosphatidylglycerophosphatase A
VLLGFGLFRFFDIVKPLGIRWIEKIPGGVGVVADDVVAALYANLTLQLIGLALR